MTKKTVDVLQEMGYFEILDEDVMQRLRNARDNVLGNVFKSDSAKGRLDVGATVIGLEKELATWMGANGIKSGAMTRGQFGKFLGYIEGKYGVKFGNATGDNNAPASTTPTQATTSTAPTPAQPASNNTQAAQPQAPQGAQASMHPTVRNLIAQLDYAAERNSGMDQEEVEESIASTMAGVKQRGEDSHLIVSELKGIVQKHPQSQVSQWINGAITKTANESRLLKGLILKEDDVDDIMSKDEVKKIFNQIARASFNGGGANPARGGSSGGNGGASAANGAASPAASGGEAPKKPKAAEYGNQEVISMNFMEIHRQMGQLSMDYNALNNFMMSDEAKGDLHTAGRNLRSVRQAIPTDDKAFELLIILLRAIQEGR